MRPRLLGHRGDPLRHRENTLPSFLAAIACGAAGVELDVQVSADGVAVVLHDDTLERTTPGHGRVDAHSWQQLAGLGVPRLDDVLRALRGAVVAVELKPSYDVQPGLAAHVLDLARRLEVRDSVWLLAFDHRHLATARHDDANVPTAALVRDRPDDPVATVQACGATALACWWEAIDSPLVEVLRAAGRDVVAWTVDGENDALRLARLGVTTLISNRPCALAQRLREAPGAASG